MSLYSICVIAVLDAILQVRIELKTFCVLNYQLSQKFRLCLVTNFIFYFQKLVFGNRRCGVQKFSKVITPRVIPKAEEANTISRSPYTQMVRSERRAMATSMTYYGRGPHYRGRDLGRGLALM